MGCSLNPPSDLIDLNRRTDLRQAAPDDTYHAKVAIEYLQHWRAASETENVYKHQYDKPHPGSASGCFADDGISDVSSNLYQWSNNLLKHTRVLTFHDITTESCFSAPLLSLAIT
jgi:hypothetical protein